MSGKRVNSGLWDIEGAVDRFKSLWNDGVSASDIAKILTGEFGIRISRNAAIGKAHRLKLTVGTRQKPSAPKRIEAAGTRGKANNPRGRLGGDFLKSSEINPNFTEPSPIAVKGRRVKAVADDFLAAGQQPVGCRYVDGLVSASRSDDIEAGGWRYCQRPQRPGSAFCPTHHALCRTAGDAVKDFALSMKKATPAAVAAAIEVEFGIEVTTQTIRGWRAWATRKSARLDREAA